MQEKPQSQVHIFGVAPRAEFSRPYEDQSGANNPFAEYVKTAAKNATERQKEIDFAEQRAVAKQAKKALKKGR